MRCVSKLTMVGCLGLSVANTAAAQKTPEPVTLVIKTYHPTITALSTTTPTPGQTVTINGSDLLPPTWTAKLRYHDKYGGGIHELQLTGSNTALTFSTPNNVRPDSIKIQYSTVTIADAASNPIPQNERQPIVPAIFVQERPEIDAASFTSVPGSGGTFSVLPVGSHTVKGKFFIKPPGASVVISQPTLTTTVSIGQAPTVMVASTAIAVSSVQYLPTTRDEVVVSTPTTLAHNTTGFLKFATPAGVDSISVTVVRPPQNATMFEAANASTPVTNGQLLRGRQYQIRGQNLVIIQRTATGSVNVNTPTVIIDALGSRVPVSVPSPSSDTLVVFSIPTTFTGSEIGVVLKHAGGAVGIGGKFRVIAEPASPETER